MIDDKHIETWFGLPVEDHKPGAGYGETIQRFGFSYDNEDGFDPQALDDYLSDPRATSIKALVVGMPGEGSDESFDPVIGVLVKHAPKLTSLRGIFLGDILQEENEISWIEQGDVGLILAAFPQLEELRVRGGTSLRFTPCTNPGLKKLIIETGGLPTEVLHNLTRCSFPNLEHLELWLGDDGYGWDGTLEDVLPVIEPELFPNLKSLGLKNSVIQNEIAWALADAPILDQLEALDFAGGTLTDDGADALIAGPRIRGIGRLNLRRNYLTEKTIPRLRELGPVVDTADQQTPDDYNGEAHYYVAVGE